MHPPPPCVQGSGERSVDLCGTSTNVIGSQRSSQDQRTDGEETAEAAPTPTLVSRADLVAGKRGSVAAKPAAFFFHPP